MDNDAKVGFNWTITVSLGDQKNCNPNILNEEPAGTARPSLASRGCPQTQGHRPKGITAPSGKGRTRPDELRS